MAADSRERILRRIREALTVPAPARHLHGVPADAASHPPQDWLPPVPATPEELIALFAQNSEALKTDFRVFASEAEAGAALASLANEEGWKSVASHDFALGRPAVAALGLPILRTDIPYDKMELEKCDVGISGCDCLVAQTGGILVTAASAGGRALSVLPPHHVVLARLDQLVGDLSDAFARVRQPDGSIPAFLSFITGPSRTGDIERILVLGAHGPKKLTVFLVR